MEIKNIINKEKRLDRYTGNSPDRWKRYAFAKVPTAMLYDERLSGIAILAYTVLSAHTFKDTDYCYLSYETIAKEAHYTRNTAIKAIKKLEELKYVVVDRKRDGRKKNRVNWYYIKK